MDYVHIVSVYWQIIVFIMEGYFECSRMQRQKDYGGGFYSVNIVLVQNDCLFMVNSLVVVQPHRTSAYLRNV